MNRAVLVVFPWLVAAGCAGAAPAPPTDPGPPADGPRGPMAIPARPESAKRSRPFSTSDEAPAASASSAAAGAMDAPAGPLTKESIRSVIRSWYPEIKGCYERAFRDDETLRGKVIARFMIGEDGSVASVDMSESTLKKESVVACVGKLFGVMRFPKPDNGMVLITYPLEFDSEIKNQ